METWRRCTVFLIKVIRTDTMHDLLNMHFGLSSVYLRGNEVDLFI